MSSTFYISFTNGICRHTRARSKAAAISEINTAVEATYCAANLLDKNLKVIGSSILKDLKPLWQEGIKV